MTVVPDSERAPAPEVDLDLPEPEDDHPFRHRPELRLPAVLRRASWRFYVFAPVLLILVLAVPLLAWKGFSILRNEETGTEKPTTNDPEAPGFQALVTPTPTVLVLDKGPDGTLQGATLITLPSQEGGGNLIFLPVGTLLPVPLREPPEVALNALYTEAGVAGLEQRVETMLGASISEVVEVPRNQWANLVAPVAPLTVQNPTAAQTTNAAGQPVSFPEGEIQLTAEQVGLFLQADTTEEADTVRISRHDAFWTAWLAALDEAGPEAVPGEGETGVGGAVRRLIGGTRSQITLPVTPVAVPGIPAIDSDIFRPNTLEIVASVPAWIPFPTGVGRLRTRLVMGVEGQSEQLPVIAHDLVTAGAEVAQIANADEFGKERTEVVFFREDQRQQAQRLLDALGAGRLVKDNAEGDTFDVVIILGQDVIDALAGESAPASTVPGNSVPTGDVNTPTGLPQVTPGEPGGETTG